MPNLRGWEILILLAIVLLLFGSKKLPDAARGIGRSLRIFKAETKGLMEDDKTSAPAAEITPSEATPAVPPVAEEKPAAPSNEVGGPDQQPSPPSGRRSA